MVNSHLVGYQNPIFSPNFKNALISFKLSCQIHYFIVESNAYCFYFEIDSLPYFSGKITTSVSFMNNICYVMYLFKTTLNDALYNCLHSFFLLQMHVLMFINHFYLNEMLNLGKKYHFSKSLCTNTLKSLLH